MAQVPAYHAPASIDEALSLLQRLGPDATVLAGGQDVVPLMNQGRLHPRTLIDLKAMQGLADTQTRNGTIAIGALVTHRDIERSDLVWSRCGLLAEAAGQIGGGIQVRNRGTIGGAVCAGNPAYDYTPCLLAMEAEFRLVSGSGERRISAADFFRDAHVTAVNPDELLVEITVPTSGADVGFAYEKLKFTDGCYCIASAACAARLHPDGSYVAARLALGGVAPVPIRLHVVEAMLGGVLLTDRVLDEVAASAESAVRDPLNDVMADGEYRRAMAGVMARRALARATERAGRGRSDGGQRQ